MINKATLALLSLSFVGCAHAAAVHQVCTQDLDRYPALVTSDGRTASPHEVCESARTDEVTRFCVDQWDKDRFAHYGSFADCYHERQDALRPAPKHQKLIAVSDSNDDDDDDDWSPTAQR